MTIRDICKTTQKDTIVDALVIVDMQKASFLAKRHKAREVINNICSLVEHFHLNQKPVIHIRHEDDGYKKDSAGWQFIDDLKPLPTAHIVTKACCDAFIGTNLDQLLQQLHATRVVIVGCATDFCVDSTIKGAIHREYNVLIPSDAHTTGERPHIDAATLVDFFNWNWPLQLTGKAQLHLMPTSEIISPQTT